MRYLPRLCGSIIIALTLLYFAFAVLPAYHQGMDKVSAAAIEHGHFTIPGYSFEPIHGNGNWRVTLAIIGLVGTPLLTLPLMLLSVGALWMRRSILARTEIVFWIALILTIIAIDWLTAPAAQTFAIWLFD